MSREHPSSDHRPYALVLAGGGGTRLWPASRRLRPKQLLTLGGDESLLGACLRRLWDAFGKDHTLVVTAADQADRILELFPALGTENLLVEPSPRNTAPAIGIGAAAVALRGGLSAKMVVVPADAHIGDEDDYANTLKRASALSEATVVTIGIKPHKPETGFGYIKLGRAVHEGAFEVERFVEKPDSATAEHYVACGEYLWNSGMFFFTAGWYLAEARRNLPDLGAMLDEILSLGDLESVVRRKYDSVSAISVDYAIMERATGMCVVPAQFAWSDVGSWAALDSVRGKDSNGNVVGGEVVVIDGAGNVVVRDEGAPFVGTVGIRDLVVVATKDAVLVIPKDRAQDVRLIVDSLKKSGRAELL